MPTLDWIGKKAVLNHHRQVPYRLLQCDAKLSVTPLPPREGLGEGAWHNTTDNLLVQGDNLEALKALLPYYAGKVKCIYIDPPYNTGNEKWVYNDAANSPEMRDWLGKVVGAEAEDLSRHDKWLCMMYPRLALLRGFLTEDGAIVISIDDNEAHNLRALMDEVFGPTSWVCTLIWKRRQTPDSRNLNGVSADHEYVLCYGRTQALRFKGAMKDLTKYANPENDPSGPWMSDNLTGLANAVERPNLHYDIVNPATGRRYPPHPSRGWIYGQDRMAELVAAGRILWPRTATGRPRLKRYLSDMKADRTGFSTFLDAPANVAGTKELALLLGPKTFAFPKPPGLVQVLLEQLTAPDSIVLDSFAGTGTTGQAVLTLNNADGGQRRFVLVEMDGDVAENVSAHRLKAVIHGRGDEVPALGGGFRYCKLGEPLFDERGNIRESVRFPELAAHVFFTETGVPIPKKPRRGNGGHPHPSSPWKGEGYSPLLGVHNGKAVYLLFNGVMGDRRPDGGNVLTAAVLRDLPPHDGPKIVYGEGCRLGPARLKREGIVFRQIPYEIKVS